jgi:hypothetical protein
MGNGECRLVNDKWRSPISIWLAITALPTPSYCIPYPTQHSITMLLRTSKIMTAGEIVPVTDAQKQAAPTTAYPPIDRVMNVRARARVRVCVRVCAHMFMWCRFVPPASFHFQFRLIVKCTNRKKDVLPHLGPLQVRRLPQVHPSSDLHPHPKPRCGNAKRVWKQ